MKRYVIIIILLFLVAVAGFLYFSREESPFSKDTTLYKAVPVSSPFFLEFHSLKNMPFDKAGIKELISGGIWEPFFRSARQLDTLIAQHPDIPGSLRSNPFIVSYGFAGKNELVPLIITRAEEKRQQQSLERLLQIYFPPDKHTWKTSKYGKHSINEIANAENGQPLYWSFSGELMLVSPKSILLEQCIRQLSAKGINQNPWFKAVSKTVSGQAEVSFFLNHTYFSDFAGRLLHPAGSSLLGSPRQQVKALDQFAAWSEMDLNVSDDHFLLSGISAADDSLHHFLPVFAGQSPLRSGAGKILPAGTSFFCSYTFSDKESFFKRLDAYFAHSDFYYKREEQMTHFGRSTRSKIREVFSGLVKDEILVAATTIPVDPANKTVFFLLHTNDRDKAEEQLNTLLQNYAKRQEMPYDSLTMTYSVGEEVDYTVYRFPLHSLPGVWLGSPFGMAEARFVTFFDRYMVFANSERGIHEYLRSMTLGQPLGEDIGYRRFSRNTSSRANIHVYADINRSFALVKELFSQEMAEKMEENGETLRKFSVLGWQVRQEDEFYFNSMVAAFNPEARDHAQTTWQSTLGSNVILKPRLVDNHHDPSNREIIVQDENHLLHLLNGQGRVLWSLSLPGPIMGEIHQVDYYKNGNLQYLFNTREKLWLVDRNGKEVAHFPVQLRSPATNGVNVFDYDNNRNYRYFVAGEDQRVYAYDATGKIVQGWEFEKTAHPVTTPVEHYRIGRKDYIVFQDKSKVYIQNRRGQTRVETASWFENSQNPLAIDLNGRPKIVVTDTEGNVHYIYFNGEHVQKETGGFSSEHYFTVADLNGDEVPDFIFVDGKEVTVINEEGKRLFREKTENELSFPPNIYTFGPDLKKVGVTDATANRIYLFNPDGSQHEGFPLHGNTEFTIGKLTADAPALHLLVGSRGGRLYNYTLE